MPELIFPEAGVHRGFAYQRQPPFSTIDANNVRRADPLQQRRRGGRRAGLLKTFAQQLGGGQPVRMLQTLNTNNTDGSVAYLDEFPGSAMNLDWDAAPWTAGLPNVGSGQALGGTNSERGAILDPQAINTGKTYRVMLQLSAGSAADRRNTFYTLDAWLDDAAPIDTNRLYLVLTFGALQGEIILTMLHEPSGRTAVSGFLPQPTVAKPWLMLEVGEDGIARAYFDGVQQLSMTLSGLTPDGTRVGFELGASSAVQFPAAETFRLEYVDIAGPTPPVSLLAISNGQLYRELQSGAMTAAAGAIASSFTTTERLQAVDRLGKVYIADFAPVLHKQTNSNGQINASNVLDDSDIADWTALGISTNAHVVEITSPAAAVGTYAISSIHATNGLTLIGGPGSQANVNFRILRGMKIFDQSSGLTSLWTSTLGKGSIPGGCSMIAMMKDTILLAGDPDMPNGLFLLRRGDPHDAKYGQPDVNSAVAFIPGQQGSLGEPVRALIPGGDDYVLVSGVIRMHILRGHPGRGGDVDPIRGAPGIVDRTSFCLTTDGWIVWLSADGLYGLPPGVFNYAVPISRGPLPAELRNLSPSLYGIELSFDVQRNAILIHATPKTPGPGIGWWIDWENKGFWNMSLDQNHHPSSLLSYALSTGGNRMVLGGRDGYIRSESEEAVDDDGVAIPNHVYLGPLMLGSGDDLQGLLSEIRGNLDILSGAVDYAVFVGDTPQEAYQSGTPAFTGTFSPGLGYVDHPRVAGRVCYIRLSGQPGSRWSMESVIVDRQPMGRILR